MNDRIRQLAVQAHLSWCIENDFDQENLQEFAELLVKECLGQIDDVINDTGENGAYLAYTRVEEYLGSIGI